MSITRRDRDEIAVLVVTSTLAPRIVEYMRRLSSRFNIYAIYINFPSTSKAYPSFPNNIKNWPIKCPPTIFSLSETRGLRKLLLIPILIKMLYKIITVTRMYRIDLVHANDAIPSGFLAALGFTRKPLIISPRGSDICIYAKKIPYKYAIRYALTKAIRIIALSKDLKEKAIISGAKEGNTDIIVGGVDEKRFRPGDKEKLRQDLHLPSGITILFVGNLIKLKRVDSLIRVCANLSKRFSFFLLIIGNGPEEQRLRDLTKQLDMKNVIFQGRVIHKEMHLFMAASDILALPSESEGLPDCVQEAMACGLPIIASNVGGLPDLINDGKNGFLINTEAEMSNKLAELMSSANLRSKMGNDALQFARTTLSFDKVINRIEKLYNHAVKQ